MIQNPRESHKKNKALLDSEARGRAIFENAAIGIVHGDSAGRFLRVNQKFCAIVGYSREELLGKNSLDFTHPDDLARDEKGYREVISGQRAHYRTEKRYIHADGHVVPVELSAMSFQL